MYNAFGRRHDPVHRRREDALLRFQAMHILQVTDPHLYGSASGRLRGGETDSSLNAVLDDAFARVPDYSAVLVTADPVHDDPSGYLRFRSTFRHLKKPLPCMPGKHDDPTAMS